MNASLHMDNNVVRLTIHFEIGEAKFQNTRYKPFF